MSAGTLTGNGPRITKRTRRVLGLLGVVVAIAAIVVGVATAAPTSYTDRGETITFPQGDDSFADEVTSFTRATNANGSATTNGLSTSTLNRPDGPDNAAATPESASLGDGGSTTLRWTDNSLTGSGNANPDLHIFERGTVYEDTHVYVSPDNVNYTYVGRTTGGQPGKVDIDTVPTTQPDGTTNRIYNGTPGGVAANGSNGFGVSARLSYVRIVDVLGHLNNGGAFAGADVDAVGAIETVLLNDAPVNTVPGAQTTNEDTARVFNTANANRITVADRDAYANPVRVTLTVANGTLAPGATTTGVTVTGSGASTLTLTGTVTNVNTALNGMSFTPAANYNGPATLTVTTNDQGNSVEGSNSGSGDTVVKEDVDTVAITVSPINDAPVNAVPAPQGTNPGTALVFNTANGNRVSTSDVDAGSALARVRLRSTNGTATLSQTTGLTFPTGTNGTNDFTVQGTLSDLNAALDGLRFNPNVNFNTAGGSVRITTDDRGNTGAGGFLTDDDTVAVTVNPTITAVTSNGPKGEGTPVTITATATDVDDPDVGDRRYQFDCNNNGDYTDAGDVGPQVANAAQCTFPDNGTSRVNVRVTDGEGGSVDGFTNVTVTNVPPDAVNDAADAVEDGPDVTIDVLANDTDVPADPRTITGNTQPAAGQGTVTCSAAQCVFDPSADFNGTTSFQYTVSDGDGGVDTATVTVTVAPVNDPPVLALPGNAVSYAENAVPALIDGGATVADVDSTNFDTGTLTVDLSANAGADDRLTIASGGGISVSGSAVSYSGTQIATFTGGAGTTPLVVTFDADATQAAVQALARRVAFSNVSEDPSTAARTARFVVTDGDGGTSAAVSETIDVTATNDAPTISDIASRTILEDADTGDVAFTVGDPDSSGLTVSGSSSDTALVPDGNITLGGSGANRTVKVTPAANRSGGPVTATVTVSDGGRSTTDAFQVSVTPVNDAPSFDLTASPNQTVDEEAGAQTVANLATNASAGPLETQDLSFEVTNDDNGLFTAGGQPAIAANGNLSYTPAANAGGTATVTVRARDDGGTANGGVDVSATRTFTITVDPVNDAPVVTNPASLSVTEDAATAVTGISISDADAGNADITLTLSVPNGEGTLAASGAGGVTVAGSGSRRLTLTGTVASIGAFVAAEGVKFTTAQDATAPVTLTLTADDDGNSGSGGAKTDTETTTLNVAADNDAPVNSVPGPRSTDEDAALVFSNISTADVDAQSADVRVALSVTNGALRLSRTTGLAFTDGGNGQSSMTFTGSLADVNAALDGLRFDPSSDYSGPAQFTITTNDRGNTGSGGAKSDTDTVDVTVNAVNDRPLADPDGPYGATEDTTLNVSAADGVLDGDTDTEGTPLFADLVTRPARGTLTLDADGSFEYVPAPDDDSPVTFVYRACEQGSNPLVCSEDRTVTIGVTAVNDAPTITAIGDETTLEDSDTGDIELSVSDPDAAAGDLTLTGGSSNQTLVADAAVTFGGTGANRTVNVTPAANRFGGPARITVTVSDGTGPGSRSATTTFDLDVTPVNDAPSFTKGPSQTVAEDAGAQSVSGWATSISEGPFEDQDVSFVVTNDDDGLFTAGGRPAVAPDGTLTYTPAPNATGTAVVKVKATDNGGSANQGADESAEQTFEITLNPVNDPPVVSITSPAGSTQTFEEGPQSRLYEYSVDDTDGPQTSITESCGTGGAKVADEQGDPATRSFRCVFGAGPATPTVGVTADDGGDAGNVGSDTVEVTVSNVAPRVIAAAAQSADEGESENFELGSFTDPGNDGPWLVTVDWGDALPDTTFTAASPGSLPSRPHAYDESEDHDVTVTVTEAGPAPASASAGFRVSVADVAPIAADDAPPASPEGGTVTLDVLANDTDPDGDQLTVKGSTDGRHGTVNCTTAGSCVYTPGDADFFGTDSFEYTISDGDGGEDTATVNVVTAEVNDAPQGTDDTSTTQRNQPLVFPAGDLLGNDKAGPPNEADQTLAVTGVGEAVNGLVLLDDKSTPGRGDDTITFIPAPGYNGNGASFEYTVCDDGRTGGAPDPKCQVVTVRVTVTLGPVNSAPVASDGVRTMDEDALPIVVNFAPLVSDDETADSGLAYDVSIAPADAAKGTLLGVGSTRTFSPARNFHGTVEILYTVADRGAPDNCGVPNPITCAASRASEQKKVTVTVGSVNDAVVADNDTGTTPEDTSLSLATSSLTANDALGPVDEANQTLTVTGVSNALHGTARLDGDRAIFTPAANYNGPASFTYTVCDNGNPESCDEATVNLEITPVNDAPVARDDRASTGKAAAVSNSFISQYTSAAQSTPTRLHRLNTAKEPYGLDKIGANIASPMNAIGYRSTNRSLYGYRITKRPGVVKVNPKTGAALYLGVPKGMPAASAKGFIAGDVSPNGSTYYLYAAQSGVLWKVDLARFKATSIRLTSRVALADFAVSPTDGNLYGVGVDGKLVRVDPRKGKVTSTSVAGLARGGYGAAWFTAKGDLIAYENGLGPRSGTLNWIASPTRAPKVVSTQAGPSTLGNDGAAYVAPPDPAGLKVVINVLANDGDPDGALDRNTLRIVQPPANGTVGVNADRTVTYTSASTYRGRDTFRYEVCDGATPRRCATATASITEAPVGP